MDLLTIVGMLFGVCTIILGQFLEGGHLVSLLNVPALIIVFGGTCGAVMIETPWKTFFRSLHILPWIFLPPRSNIENYVKKITAWSTIAKRKGILGLENALVDEDDKFVKKGLTLLIDKGDAKSIRNVLRIDLEQQLNNEIDAAKVFENMGGYSPTIGIIGAVIGLIQVMGNLGEPSKLGLGIAVAFVATIYGVGLANLFFIPIANKLKRIVIKQQKMYEMILEGLASIADGENINILELKLLGFTSEE
jgi:chemotaxis protein MotA